jgi:polar amino acid transport system substrate-binding protein
MFGPQERAVAARRLLAAGLCAALLGWGAAARAETYQLVTFEFPPYEYEEGGGPTGIAVDILREAFQRLGHAITVKVQPWARSLEEVKTGGADAIFTAYKTAEREQFLDFSREVLAPQIVSLFVRQDSPVAFDGDIAKLADRSFGVVNQISYGPIFDDAVKAGTLRRIDTSNSSDLNLQKLVAGRYDVMPSNRYVGLYLLKKRGNLADIRVLNPDLQNVPSYIGFS